jgi:SAM-dependent methyltransferase
MAVNARLRQTQAAFDGVAAGYDRLNAGNATLCSMRARARHAVHAYVPRGSHVLDLGCGPGPDAVYLAKQGYRVTAIDWSPGMVEAARCRVHAAGVGDRVDVLHAGIHELDRIAPAVPFDAVYSNFGPLNCVDDLPAAARMIASRLRPGGVLVASVIGRVCPWELALYLGRGQWQRAAIRFRQRMVPVPLEGRTVWTRYYTPGAFERVFGAAGFTRVSVRALGLFVPPPYLDGFANRHPGVVASLQRADDRFGGWPLLRSCGDHFLIALRRCDT